MSRSHNRWSNLEKCEDLFNVMIFHYLSSKNKEQGYPEEQRSLIITDTFKGQENDEMKRRSTNNKCELAIVPHNVTNKFQPLENSNSKIEIKKFKESRDKEEELGTFFTDLSKAFDYIDYDLLITKLSWYGVTPESLKLIFSYLSNQTQGVRINNSYSRKSDIKYGVPQGSVLRPLLFNINLTDLFLECEDDNITSYADDTTLYSCAQDLSSVISELQRIAKKIFDWCRNNPMKTNPGKFHVMLSSNTQTEIRFVNTSSASSLSEKLLGKTLISKLKFEEHINEICNIVNKKLSTLHCTGSHVGLDK